MRHSQISYGFLGSFLVILFLLRWWQTPLPTIIVWFLLGMAVAILISSVLLKKRTLSVLTAVVMGGSVAVLCAARTVHVPGPIDIESFADGEYVTIHGWIAEMPDIRPVQTKFTIETDFVEDSKGKHEAKGRILVTEYAPWPPLRYGDEVSARGKLEKPSPIEDFDYPHYLELHGIRAVIFRGQVDASENGSSRPIAILGTLYKWRNGVEDRLGLLLPEPHASLLAGLLTGSRRGLPKHLTDDFRTAGLTHIIAISGYNITIILAVLGSLLFWLPIKKRFVPLLIGITLFTLFVGAGPPVVRAAIMGLLGLLALQAGRVPTVRLVVLWTAFFMLLWNPMMLWYDASFQLSFLAVIGITELGPVLKRLLKRVPETFAIRESLVATIAALIATLPLSILLFRQISLVAPLTNVLVAPLIPLAMLGGAISLFLSLLWMPLGLLAAYFTWAILQAIIWIAEIGAKVPFGSFIF